MSHIALILENYLKRTNTFIRFLLIGFLNTIVGLSTTFMLMNVMDINYWYSTLLGNSMGAIVSYLLNRSFTFKSDVPFYRGAFRFIVVIFTCYFVSYWVSEQVAKWMIHAFYFFSPITKNNLAVLIGTAIYTISNYMGQKFFVFYHTK